MCGANLIGVLGRSKEARGKSCEVSLGSRVQCAAMSPFGAAQRPVVMGHRGAPLAAPENTPASFAIAATSGATWVELDARRSADGIAVVHHDAWTADGQPLVERTAVDLRAHGVWSLRDVLAGLPPDLGVDVELKNLPGEPDYDEGDALVGLVAPLLGPIDRPVMTSSFNPVTVLALRASLPAVPVGLLTTPGVRAAAATELAEELGVQVSCPHVDTPDLGAATVASAHAAGLAVLVWTVDDPTRAVLLAELGVDALCTNDPSRLVRALA